MKIDISTIIGIAIIVTCTTFVTFVITNEFTKMPDMMVIALVIIAFACATIPLAAIAKMGCKSCRCHYHPKEGEHEPQEPSL
jgi:Na+/citrate or Na+/malate symporter